MIAEMPENLEMHIYHVRELNLNKNPFANVRFQVDIMNFRILKSFLNFNVYLI